MKLLLFSLLFFIFNLVALKSIAESDGDYTWWNTKHQWDGKTPWFRMLTTSAANFGPNALPVPELRDGKVEDQFHFELRSEAHISKGDNTYNIFTSLISPIGKRASFEVFIVPFEYFSMDTITRDERYVRQKDAKGIAGGDFWFGTNIQIVKDKRFPDLIFSTYFKTASGTNLSCARFTDSPGYYFLLNSGKNIGNIKHYTLRVYGHLGTYIWQTMSNINSQDDAYCYGLGLKLFSEKSFIKTEISGYNGYLNNGDMPCVFRFQSGLTFKNFNWIFRYQAGLQDFNYHSFSIGGIWKFGKPLE